MASDVVERIIMSLTVSLRVRGGTLAGASSAVEAALVGGVFRSDGKRHVRNMKTMAGGAISAP